MSETLDLISNRKYDGIRENRPHTYNDLGGQSEELEKDFKKRCLKSADRTFAQGLQCQQINSLNALMSLEKAVFIAHSPQGCAGCAALGVMQYRIGQAHRGVDIITNPRFIVSNLDQNDIVLGGEKKLVEAVESAQKRYAPKVIFVFTSCASGIIGDDVDSILDSLQPHIEAMLIPVHCEGFKSKICASGFDAAFLAISKYILKGEKKETQKGLINLFAPVSISYKDELEIERMLGQLDIQTNFIPFYSSIEKIQQIPTAQASTAICKVFADEFMKELERDYQIPYAHTVMPVGMRNTDKWYRSVAALFGKRAEVEAIIEAEHKRILPEIDKIKERLQGKKVFICGGTGRSFAAAALIDDYGMQLIGLETPTYDEDAQIDIEYLTEIHKDFVIDIANMQPFEQVNLLSKLKPDVFIGVSSWAAKLGIPTTHILDMKRPTMGYDGILYLGNKIADQIENPGFNVKLAKHSSLPYKQSWYNDNPFKFIKTLGE